MISVRPYILKLLFFLSAPGDIAATISCGYDEMETVLRVNDAVDAQSIHLDNSSCVPSSVQKARVIIKTPLTGCGTQLRVSQDGQEIVYYNHIYMTVRVPAANPVIVRDHVVVLLIECRFPRVHVISVATYSPSKVLVHTNTGKWPQLNSKETSSSAVMKKINASE